MKNNLWMKLLWVIVYGITAYFTFTGNMQVAMYWMAGAMLAESLLGFLRTCIKR